MKINGKYYDYESLPLNELLEKLNLNPSKVVVELNGVIANLEENPLVGKKSELEIVQFVGGG